ncbi:hypothetical protein MW887_009925, partial [Aspergillus wentii]
PLHPGLPTGVEPFWKLAFVFKCLCDTIILDDFKSALDRIRGHWWQGRTQIHDLNEPRAGLANHW